MKQNEFLIKNKSVSLSSLYIAGLFVLFRIFITVFGAIELSDWKETDYVIFGIALLFVVVDSVDLYRINKGSLKLVFNEEGIKIYSYMFLTKSYNYSEMSSPILREKDIEFKYFGKSKILSGPSQSDLIRMMKLLEEKIN